MMAEDNQQMMQLHGQQQPAQQQPQIPQQIQQQQMQQQLSQQHLTQHQPMTQQQQQHQQQQLNQTQQLAQQQQLSQQSLPQQQQLPQQQLPSQQPLPPQQPQPQQQLPTQQSQQQQQQQQISTQQQQQQQPQAMPQQQQQMSQQHQQQAVAVTMPLNNNMEQQGHVNQQNTMAISAAMSHAVSQPQTIATGHMAVNSSGAPVHMTMSQLTASPQNQTAVMTQSSTPQHHAMIHPAMSMGQSPLQQVQVIPQPLQASYLQQLYQPQQQQQMLFPGNLTLQHASMAGPTLQSIGPAQGLSLQLQTKTTLDPKASASSQALQSAVNKGISLSTNNMMTGQVIGAGPKANFQQQMMTASGKPAIIHSQAQFTPSNTNQTVVIGQLVPNQQSVFNQKALADSQKGKTYMINQQATLQPKSPIFPSNMPSHSSAQVFNGNQFKQLTSSPQLITSQSPSTVLSQAQLLGSLQALGASFPQGISWATPSGLQTPFLPQNQFVIKTQQSDMLIHTQPQTAVQLPVASSAALPATTFASAAVVPQKPKQVRVRPGSSVATQTVVSSVSALNTSSPPYRAQVKAKPRTISSHLTPGPIISTPQMATTQTQTNQLVPQAQPPVQLPSPPLPTVPLPQLKSDAANQTRFVPEVKNIMVHSKSVGTDMKHQSPPAVKSQAKVVPSAKVLPELSTCVVPALTVPSTATSCATTITVSTTVAPMPIDTVCSIEHSDVGCGPDPPLPLPEEQTPTVPQPIVPVSVPPIMETKPLDSMPDILPAHPVVKDKQPQKAIVKPHVLTHVIDGYVIQEGPEPFPVSRSSLLTEINTPKPIEANSNTPEASKVVSSERKRRIHGGPVELAKCEFCGKLGAKSKFKRSKRFCSTSCAKRYNVCCSKRLGLLSPTQENAVPSGKSSRKKKMGLKSRKGWRKSEGGRLSYNASEWTQEEQVSKTIGNVNAETARTEEEPMKFTNEEETTESPSGAESSMTSSSLGEKDSMDVDASDSAAPASTIKAPNKWTVQEVFEFIRDLAGCSDYADEFRSQEIDGQALLLLKEDHLMSAMGMKLGPALKLIARINSIKEELGQT